ncbi:glycoside hydrolase family 130 protein [Phycisphaerales bacterium AB-hyl4]|uniref:Glycoside hydrolase family 130 protein n=1 Tax=Natronomicrosphaera hydrolytica TaxID=3242702 RepID=A0ABV4U3N7_9BACT
MLERLFSHCMVRPSDIQPSSSQMKVVGVFNPGVIEVNGQVILLVRVVEQPTETREGFEPSPRFVPKQGITFDWLDEKQLDFYDPRVYHERGTGLARLRFISYLKVLRSDDGKTITDHDGPVIMPDNVYEEYGVEDPRITQIGSTYYITYVAVSRHGITTCLLSTTDFQRFTRHGIIFPPENKDVLLFPEKIVGDYLAMHRPVTSTRFRPPEMWTARSPDLIHWGGHEQMLGADSTWEQSRVGGGTPPIRTERGWLTIYHGSARPEGDQGPGTYTAGALLLDSQRPSKVIAQTREPIMTPEETFEREGFVNNVVFPTAVLERDDAYWVYYGAADENVGVTAYRREDLLNALQKPSSANSAT